MRVWAEIKEKFLEEGGGMLMEILRHHPRKFFSSRQKRGEFFRASTYSVERKSGKLVLYMNPPRGKRVKMPPEASFWSDSERLEMMAADVAGEYEGGRSMRNAFESALREFKDSNSGTVLMFNRDGTTTVE